MASTSALALGAGIGTATAQPLSSNGLLGVYGGVGFGWESSSSRPVIHEFDHRYDLASNMSTSGVTANIFGGYRMMVAGPWVLGGEVKFNFGGGTGSVQGLRDSPGSSDGLGQHGTAEKKFGFGAALTAGYLMPSGIMPFVKLGYLGKSVKFSGSFPSAGSQINSTKWLSAIEFGAGVDVPIGVIGGSLNMPAFLRVDASYAVPIGGGDFHGTPKDDDRFIRYNPGTFQAGIALGLRF
jgi:hypothetical protein